MEKIFCDFCQKEIPLGGACAVELREPRTETNIGAYEACSKFDSCKDCLTKVRSAIGVK